MIPKPKRCHVRDCHQSGAFWTVSNSCLSCFRGIVLKAKFALESRLNSLFFRSYLLPPLSCSVVFCVWVALLCYSRMQYRFLFSSFIMMFFPPRNVGKSGQFWKARSYMVFALRSVLQRKNNERESYVMWILQCLSFSRDGITWWSCLTVSALRKQPACSVAQS